MSYQTQYLLSVLVTVLLGMLGAVQLGNADLLGITPRVSAWLGIASAALGIAAGFLPNVRRTPAARNDPDALADRIWQLPPDDRRYMAQELTARARRET